MYLEGGFAFLQKRRGGCKTPPESCRGYPLNPPTTQKCRNRIRNSGRLVEEGGFEPPKAMPTDLQSAPFGHSGTPPYISTVLNFFGAGERNRTINLLITNQLLCRLSYTSKSNELSIAMKAQKVKPLAKKFVHFFFGCGGLFLFRTLPSPISPAQPVSAGKNRRRRGFRPTHSAGRHCGIQCQVLSARKIISSVPKSHSSAGAFSCGTICTLMWL